MQKILIHSALLCESQNLINFYKLKKIADKNYKIYLNESIYLIISGIGKKNTINALSYAFSKNIFTKAFNIGIAGCSDKKIQIGSIFCTNKKNLQIPYATLSTVEHFTKDIKTTLVDMEAKHFMQICENLQVDYFVLKVVSDYLSDEILKKSFVIDIMNKAFLQWKYLI